jgi:hypothetical protein
MEGSSFLQGIPALDNVPLSRVRQEAGKVRDGLSIPGILSQQEAYEVKAKRKLDKVKHRKHFWVEGRKRARSAYVGIHKFFPFFVQNGSSDHIHTDISVQFTNNENVFKYYFKSQTLIMCGYREGKERHFQKTAYEYFSEVLEELGVSSEPTEEMKEIQRKRRAENVQNDHEGGSDEDERPRSRPRVNALRVPTGPQEEGSDDDISVRYEPEYEDGDWEVMSTDSIDLVEIDDLESDDEFIVQGARAQIMKFSQPPPEAEVAKRFSNPEQLGYYLYEQEREQTNTRESDHPYQVPVTAAEKHGKGLKKTMSDGAKGQGPPGLSTHATKGKDRAQSLDEGEAKDKSDSLQLTMIQKTLEALAKTADENNKRMREMEDKIAELTPSNNGNTDWNNNGYYQRPRAKTEGNYQDWYNQDKKPEDSNTSAERVESYSSMYMLHMGNPENPGVGVVRPRMQVNNVLSSEENLPRGTQYPGESQQGYRQQGCRQQEYPQQNYPQYSDPVVTPMTREGGYRDSRVNNMPPRYAEREMTLEEERGQINNLLDLARHINKIQRKYSMQESTIVRCKRKLSSKDIVLPSPANWQQQGNNVAMTEAEVKRLPSFENSTNILSDFRRLINEASNLAMEKQIFSRDLLFQSLYNAYHSKFIVSDNRSDNFVFPRTKFVSQASEEFKSVAAMQHLNAMKRFENWLVRMERMSEQPTMQSSETALERKSIERLVEAAYSPLPVYHECSTNSVAYTYFWALDNKVRNIADQLCALDLREYNHYSAIINFQYLMSNTLLAECITLSTVYTNIHSSREVRPLSMIAEIMDTIYRCVIQINRVQSLGVEIKVNYKYPLAKKNFLPMSDNLDVVLENSLFTRGDERFESQDKRQPKIGNMSSSSSRARVHNMSSSSKASDKDNIGEEIKEMLATNARMWEVKNFKDTPIAKKGIRIVTQTKDNGFRTKTFRDKDNRMVCEREMNEPLCMVHLVCDNGCPLQDQCRLSHINVNNSQRKEYRARRNISDSDADYMLDCWTNVAKKQVQKYSNKKPEALLPLSNEDKSKITQIPVFNPIPKAEMNSRLEEISAKSYGRQGDCQVFTGNQ